MPAAYLSKLFQRLVKAGFIKAEKGRQKGYVFARSPEGITLLELFEVVENGPLFDDCPLRYCGCGGTTTNCRIYHEWHRVTEQMIQMLGQTSLIAATWDHPEHRFPDAVESAAS